MDNKLQGKGVLLFKNNLQLEGTFSQNTIDKKYPIMLLNLETGQEFRVS